MDSDVEEFVVRVASQVANPVRLEAVAATRLLDSQAEVGFDRLAALAARVLECPFGFVTVVDDSRSFWKACFGIEATEPDERQNHVDESFCQYVIGLGDVLLVDDARLDPRTQRNPSIASMGVVAWAGAPVRVNGGQVVGTLCVVDTTARHWTAADGELLGELAKIAADEIAARQAAIAAKRSEMVLNAVLDRAPIGFALVDQSLRYELVNDAMAAMNGHAAADHLGRTVGDMIPDVAPAVEPLIRDVFATGTPVVAVEVSGKTAASPATTRTWLANYYRLELEEASRSVGIFVEDVGESAHSRGRAELWADITANLATAHDTDGVGSVIAGHGARYLGASVAMAGIIGSTPETLQVLTAAPLAAQIENWDRDDRDDTIYGRAFLTGAPILVEDADHRRREFPATVAIAEAMGTVSSAAAPIRNAQSEIVGVLAVGWPHRMARSDFPRFELEALANIVGQSVERIRGLQERTELIGALQHSLLRPVPNRLGVALAARYVPAGSVLGFGGDWYEAVPVDEYRTALVVGDVVGHSPTAAARMSELRTVVSNLLRLDTDLSTIFDQAERLSDDDGSFAMATVGIVMIDSAQATLTSVAAGHLPPIVRTSCGSAKIVPTALRPWLGLGGSPLQPVSIGYEPGTSIVLYTDGLIERRGSDIQTDLDALTRHISSLDAQSADRIADQLIHEYAIQPNHDDIAIIVALLG